MRYLSAHYIFPVSSPPLKNGIICVNDNGCIVDVIDTGGKLEERANLEFYNGILVPGFVNAHCHLELSHLRHAIAPHGGLSDFVLSVVRMRGSNPETILDAAKKADEEMTKNGIVAAGDISNSADTLGIKRNSRIRHHTFVEMFGLDVCRSKEIFAAAEQIKQEYVHAGLPASLAPHAVYSVSPALWEMLHQSYSSSPPQVVSIHHRESGEEKELSPQMTACLRKASRCLLVHNTFSSKVDLLQYTTSARRFYFALCPGSNLFIQNRLPDLQLFASPDFYENTCLGTDSLASNTCLSILEEMKIIQQNAPDLPLETLLQWATLNGAQALGFDYSLGSLEQGKKPGINLITGIDFEKKKFTTESVVKMLVGLHV